MAVAAEQEKRALVEEMRVRVVEAEAFRSGNLSIVNDVRRRMIRAGNHQRGPETGGSSA